MSPGRKPSRPPVVIHTPGRCHSIFVSQIPRIGFAFAPISFYFVLKGSMLFIQASWRFVEFTKGSVTNSEHFEHKPPASLRSSPDNKPLCCFVFDFVQSVNFVWFSVGISVQNKQTAQCRTLVSVQQLNKYHRFLTKCSFTITSCETTNTYKESRCCYSLNWVPFHAAPGEHFWVGSVALSSRLQSTIKKKLWKPG